jgi:hypothetical protein
MVPRVLVRKVLKVPRVPGALMGLEVCRLNEAFVRSLEAR